MFSKTSGKLQKNLLETGSLGINFINILRVRFCTKVDFLPKRN